MSFKVGKYPIKGRKRQHCHYDQLRFHNGWPIHGALISGKWFDGEENNPLSPILRENDKTHRA